LDLENDARESIDSILVGRIDIAQDIDWHSKVSILSQTIGCESKLQDWSGKVKTNRDRSPKKISTKGLALSGSRNGKLDLVRFYTLESTKEYLKKQKQQLQSLQPDSDQVDITQYPEGSFCIRFELALEKPYISKDDMEFYVVDNPIRKEWVFKIPYIAGSQWKGVLHHSMVRSLAEKFDEFSKDEFVKQRLAITRIFGNEVESVKRYFRGNDTDEQRKEYAEEYERKLQCILKTEKDQEPLVSSRVFFYPTYFSNMTLEVINPHTEYVKGINPIYFETIPKGSSGTFCLLYVPLTQRWGTDFKDIKTDVMLIERFIHDMMIVDEFGAKTSLVY
jgi:CRISPR/Cas system CMR subunit Cmr6 (Cas7 group RAMP superfamily)